MLHLAGYFEDVDQGAVFQAITAMADQALNTEDDDITVPSDLPFLAGAALLSAATTLTRAQIQSPSLRQLANFDISKLVNADDFADPIAIDYFPANPMRLDPEEDIQFFVDSDHAAAIEIQGFVWLTDGPVTPVGGEQFTVRLTSGITIVQGVWTNGNLTFGTTLPAGTYDVVGFRAIGTNLQAARLVFIGMPWRPGVPADNALGDSGFEPLRHGNSGVLGSFKQTALPSVDAVGITDTTQQYFIDLIKTS